MAADIDAVLRDFKNWRLEGRALEACDALTEALNPIPEALTGTLVAAMVELGVCQVEVGRWDEATETLEGALGSCRAHFGAGHVLEAAALNARAALSAERDAYGEAMEAAEAAEAIWEGSPEVIRARITRARILRDTGHYGEARELDAATLEEAVAHFGAEHPLSARVRFHLGEDEDLLGHYEAAEGHYRAALAHFLSALGPRSYWVARARECISWIERDVKHALEVAREHQLAALDIMTGCFGEPGHPHTGSMLRSLARTHLLEDDYEAAMPLMAQALQIAEKWYGPESFQASLALSQMASWHLKLGKATEAEALFERCLAIETKLHGPRSYNVSAALGSLATCCETRGEQDSAESHRREALSIAQESLGADHLLVSGYHRGIGVHLYNRGLYDEAEAHFRAALEIRRARLDEGHPDIADALSDLAAVCHSNGMLEEARDLLEGILDLDRTQFDGPHSMVADHLAELALVCRKMGDLDEAISLATEALGMTVAIYGPEHFNAGWRLKDIADIELVAGNYDQAEQQYWRCIALLEAHYGESHPDLAEPLASLTSLYCWTWSLEAAFACGERALRLIEPRGTCGLLSRCLNNLALAHRQAGDLDRARELFERGLEVRRSLHGDFHIELVTILNNLGDLATEERRWDEAKAHLMESLRIRRALLSPHHPDLIYNYANLARLHAATQEWDSAIPLFERALEMSSRDSSSRGTMALGLAIDQGWCRLGCARHNPDEALKHLEVAEALFSKALEDTTSYGLARLRPLKGLCALHMAYGRLDEAADLAAEAWALLIESADTHTDDLDGQMRVLTLLEDRADIEDQAMVRCIRRTLTTMMH